MDAEPGGVGQHWCLLHRGSLRSSGLPGDAVRGGSIYLPRREQVHGHRSVESAAPGEAQSAASLRHGPGQSDTGAEGVVSADRGGSSVFGVWVRVREVERPHAHGDAERTAEDELISPSRLGSSRSGWNRSGKSCQSERRER